MAFLLVPHILLRITNTLPKTTLEGAETRLWCSLMKWRGWAHDVRIMTYFNHPGCRPICICLEKHLSPYLVRIKQRTTRTRELPKGKLLANIKDCPSKCFCSRGQRDESLLEEMMGCVSRVSLLICIKYKFNHWRTVFSLLITTHSHSHSEVLSCDKSNRGHSGRLHSVDYTNTAAPIHEIVFFAPFKLTCIDILLATSPPSLYLPNYKCVCLTESNCVE